MSLRARPPPTPPPNGGDASRLDHVLSAGLQMLNIKPEPIEAKKRDQRCLYSPTADPCEQRKTRSWHTKIRLAPLKEGLKGVGDDEVEYDEESGVHEVLWENYNSVTSMEDALEADYEEQLNDAQEKRIDKITAYRDALESSSNNQDKAFGEMASAMAEYAVEQEKLDNENQDEELYKKLENALTEMTVKVLTYRRTLQKDTLKAQKMAFDKMVEALALYTSLENDATVKRNVYAMVKIAYSQTFDTNGNKLSQDNQAEKVTSYVGIVDRSIRDFDLIVIREDKKIHLKLSARAGQIITNETWVVSDTNLSLKAMQTLVLEKVKGSGAIRTKEGMQTPTIKARLKTWIDQCTRPL